MTAWSVLGQTAQPRHALTLPKIKCKLYSKVIQTCQFRKASATTVVLLATDDWVFWCFRHLSEHFLWLYFGLWWTFLLPRQPLLATYTADLRALHRALACLTSVFPGYESQSHLTGSLPMPASFVALICLLSWSFWQKKNHCALNQPNKKMPSVQKCHGKAASTNVVGHTLL